MGDVQMYAQGNVFYGDEQMMVRCDVRSSLNMVIRGGLLSTRKFEQRMQMENVDREKNYNTEERMKMYVQMKM